MTPKEKAAEEYSTKTGFKGDNWQCAYRNFLAGCTYQEQVDKEVINECFDMLLSIQSTTTIYGEPLDNLINKLKQRKENDINS